MDTKIYWLLMPPFFLAGILLFVFLPKENWFLIFLLPLIFWGVYYSWVHSRRKNKD
ncbi:Permease [Mesobacillus thioparans]